MSECIGKFNSDHVLQKCIFTTCSIKYIISKKQKSVLVVIMTFVRRSDGHVI